MKTLVFPILLLSITIIARAQSPAFSWVKQMGGSLYGVAVAIDRDSNGNIYNTGNFQETVDFDPGPGTYTLSSPGFESAFACKLDAQGNFLWAKQIGASIIGSGYARARDQAVCSNGDVYITGDFGGRVDFDPGAANTTFTSTGEDIFIMKLDAQGNFIWANKFGGLFDDWGTSITTDAGNAAYLTGLFSSNVDFDPSPTSIYSLTSSPGTPEVFVLKLDASGNFVWARQMITTGGNNPNGALGSGITLDNGGNIYCTGCFAGTSDFAAGTGTYTLNSTGNLDAFVWKLSPTGNFIWARSFGGNTEDRGNNIITDAAGNSIVTGYFTGAGDFDPGPGTYSLTSAGLKDFFISKFDPQGNLIWTKGIGGSGNDSTSSLALGVNGDLYCTGKFVNTVDFDPGPGTYTLSTSVANVFISKLDISGNFKWVEQLVGSGYGSGNDLTVDVSNNVYTAGSFRSTTDFDPNAGIYILTPIGMEDVFVHKMICGISPDIVSSASVICAGNYVTLSAPGANSYTWSTSSNNNTIQVNPIITSTFTLSGVDTNGCIFSSSHTQLVDACTGIKQINNSVLPIRVYPNPNRGTVTVDLELLNSDEITINLTNSLGQIVTSVNTNNKETRLSLENLPPGIYFLQVFQNKMNYGQMKIIRE